MVGGEVLKKPMVLFMLQVIVGPLVLGLGSPGSSPGL